MTGLTRRGLIAGAAGLAASKRKRKPVGMQPDQQGVFFQLVVQGGGTFTYDAAGNLRSAEVGQTTTDPIQGVTCYAGISTFNGHGAVISLFSSTLDAQLWYIDTGTSTQGGLIASVSSAAGSDPFGNAFKAGVTSYSTGFASLVLGSLEVGSLSGGSLVTNPGNVGFGDATIASAQPFANLASPRTSAGGTAQVVVLGESQDASKPAQALITSAGSVVPSTTALLEVQGSGAITSGGLSVTGGETADTVAVSSGQAAGKVLTATNTSAAPSGASVQFFGAGAGDRLLQLGVTGDTNSRYLADTNGGQKWGSGSAAQDCGFSRQAANVMQLTTCDLDIATAGRGLQIKEGSNARLGTATLVGGTVNVANTSVTANTRIFVGQHTPGGTVGAPFVSSVTAGTGFTIKSTSSTDTSVVSFLLIEAG